MDTEKAEFKKLVAEVREVVEQRMVRLNVVLVRRNLAEKVSRLLVTETAEALDVLVQQLGYDAVSRLR